MSYEIVEGPDGRLFVIDGTPGHYDIRPVGEPLIPLYERKYEARQDIRNGTLFEERPTS